jgi:hypothetical protein
MLTPKEYAFADVSLSEAMGLPPAEHGLLFAWTITATSGRSSTANVEYTDCAGWPWIPGGPVYG